MSVNCARHKKVKAIVGAFVLAAAVTATIQEICADQGGAERIAVRADGGGSWIGGGGRTGP